MSGLNRLLTKRDKSASGKHRLSGWHHHASSNPEPSPPKLDSTSASDFFGLFHYDGPPSGAPEEQMIKSVRQKILKKKGVLMRDGSILWALHSDFAHGDVEQAGEFLLAASDACEGLITKYDPTIKLLGAQNRRAVTCYLDTTLFSMFSRLDSFEAMLYNTFNDTPRNKLAFLLRLWVNLLRMGKLITTDITKEIQDSLAECGWEDACNLRQQDASEAFTFITGMLELPLLTLKMDIYHTGREDAADDHKFINERLLEVAIPPDAIDGTTEVTLEDCLEDYFNNRIEVRRYLERRSTVSSMRSMEPKSKGSAVHIETVEIDPDGSPTTPLATSPAVLTSPRSHFRNRSQSIIQERFIPARTESTSSPLKNVLTHDSQRSRAGSVRKEVMMPAWQFFSLIPWYTDNAPSNDAQVAHHFSSKRPVLGLCLKRYAMTEKGTPKRLNTKIDIPVEIGLPHFIQDDHMEEAGPLFGNFKLSLQSVVCHRGDSIDSGHYVALARSTSLPLGTEGHIIADNQLWMRFDDLAPERVTMVDIETALNDETPYLLFYQILPVDGDPGQITAGEVHSVTTPSDTAEQSSNYLSPSLGPSLGPTTTGPTSGRPSFELSITDDLRGRSPAESRRQSTISFADHGSSPPISPKDTHLEDPVKSLMTARSKSGSRTSTGKAVEGLGRTLSKLRVKSRDPKPETKISETKGQIHDHQENQTVREGLLGNHDAQNQAIKGQKREKSKNRLSKMSARSKEADPDRECVVM